MLPHVHVQILVSTLYMFFFFASYKYTTKEGQITSFAVLLCLHSPPPSWTINVRLVRLLQLSKLGLQVADENSDLELCWKILFFGPNFEGIVKFCMPSINRPTLLNNKNQLNPRRWGGNIFQIWWCKLFFFFKCIMTSMSPKPQQSCPLSKISQSLTTIHLFVKCASTEIKQFYTCSLIVCLWCSTLGSVLDLPVESEPDQADAEEDQLGSG